MTAARHDRLLTPPPARQTKALAQEDDQEIATAHTGGVGIRALARQHGVSREAIRCAIRRHAARTG